MNRLSAAKRALVAEVTEILSNVPTAHGTERNLPEETQIRFQCKRQHQCNQCKRFKSVWDIYLIKRTLLAVSVNIWGE